MLSFNFKSRIADQTSQNKLPPSVCGCVRPHSPRAAAGVYLCVLNIWLNPENWKLQHMIFGLKTQEYLWTNQRIGSSSPLCLILILPFVCPHMCVDASSLTFFHRFSVGNVCFYCVHHNHDDTARETFVSLPLCCRWLKLVDFLSS